MYLMITPKPNGRKYLMIVQGFRNSEGKPRKKTVKSIGYLDELEKEYEDPIAYFKAEAKRMDEERKADNASYTFTVEKQDTIPVGTDFLRNFGYTALSSIYHELGLDTFLSNRQRHTNESYDADTIMKMLVYSRLLYPSSKKKAYENRRRFFEKSDYSLDDVYRSLSFLSGHSMDMQIWMNERIKEKYQRDTSLIYYDVTNYYFETDSTDDLKRKGVSKEHRPNPIVQMGLFMDNNGIPITYELFPGNTNDCLTYRPNLGNIKKNFDFGRVITVADKGMTTGDNIWYTTHTPTKDGYVFSMSVRGADRRMKDYVLDGDGYEWMGDDYKHKSRLCPRTISVTTASGKKMKKDVDEKQVVFYSGKYARRAKEERAAALEKAADLIRHPGNYTQATSYGAAGYIKNISFDKNTGEIITPSSSLMLDEERIHEEEALDGYYVLLTSEYEESDSRIIDIYRGLWQIEESFRITKSDLEARPVYVSTHDHIEAHFLTCFVALTVARLLQIKTSKKYSVTRLLESLQKSVCFNVSENLYMFTYYDEILQEIGRATGIDFNRKVLALSEIKKILGETKNQVL